jgi:hypothetical protein
MPDEALVEAIRKSVPRNELELIDLGTPSVPFCTRYRACIA